MTTHELLAELARCPLVASVQASLGSPMADPSALALMARASQAEGVRVLRLEGLSAIREVRRATGLPTIGLIKVPGAPVVITPTETEVGQLLGAGCEIVAMDATARPRPGGASLEALLAMVRRAGRLALADCDDAQSMRRAAQMGFDLIATTLAGYTGPDDPPEMPDLGLVRTAADWGKPILAEGRYAEAWQVAAALRAGAAGVVSGGAINDPVKQTRRLLSGARRVEGPVGAFDLGGTWLRFGVFDGRWSLLRHERIETPADPADRLAWMRERIAAAGVSRVGVGSGGQIDPTTGIVVEAKPILPGHVGFPFTDEALGASVVALNDGLAQAWGHACHRRFAGMRVATLALGTGVGAGFVSEMRLHVGPRGEYLRINDLPGPGGRSYEDLLGGATLGRAPSEEAKADARAALQAAVETLAATCMPEVVVLSGTVGLAEWLGEPTVREGFGRIEVAGSPFGSDAGLYGAAALALYPPTLTSSAFAR